MTNTFIKISVIVIYLSLPCSEEKAQKIVVSCFDELLYFLCLSNKYLLLKASFFSLNGKSELHPLEWESI